MFKLTLDKDEQYAANCIWINGTVIMPKSYPKAKDSILELGYKIIEIDMSEFQTQDGGLSYLSLRF